MLKKILSIFLVLLFYRVVVYRLYKHPAVILTAHPLQKVFPPQNG